MLIISKLSIHLFINITRRDNHYTCMSNLVNIFFCLHEKANRMHLTIILFFFKNKTSFHHTYIVQYI